MGDTGVNSRKRRGEFNSRELARDEIAARRLVAGDLGHNYLNARGWINCCISHAKLILIYTPLSSGVVGSRDPLFPLSTQCSTCDISAKEKKTMHIYIYSPVHLEYFAIGANCKQRFSITHRTQILFS